VDGEFYLHGFIDLVYKDSGKRVRVRDHKTGGNPGSYSDLKLATNTQLIAYGVVADADLIEISFIHSNPPKDASKRYGLYTVPLAKASKKFFVVQFERTVTKMFTQEPTYNLTPDCSSCQFRPICYNAMVGGNVEGVINSQFRKKDKPVNGKQESSTGTKEPLEFDFNL